MATGQVEGSRAEGLVDVGAAVALLLLAALLVWWAAYLWFTWARPWLEHKAWIKPTAYTTPEPEILIVLAGGPRWSLPADTAPASAAASGEQAHPGVSEATQVVPLLTRLRQGVKRSWKWLARAWHDLDRRNIHLRESLLVVERGPHNPGEAAHQGMRPASALPRSAMMSGPDLPILHLPSPALEPHEVVEPSAGFGSKLELQQSADDEHTRRRNRWRPHVKLSPSAGADEGEPASAYPSVRSPIMHMNPRQVEQRREAHAFTLLSMTSSEPSTSAPDAHTHDAPTHTTLLNMLTHASSEHLPDDVHDSAAGESSHTFTVTHITTSFHAHGVPPSVETPSLSSGLGRGSDSLTNAAATTSSSSGAQASSRADYASSKVGNNGVESVLLNRAASAAMDEAAVMEGDGLDGDGGCQVDEVPTAAALSVSTALVIPPPPSTPPAPADMLTGASGGAATSPAPQSEHLAGSSMASKAPASSQRSPSLAHGSLFEALKREVNQPDKTGTVSDQAVGPTAHEQPHRSQSQIGPAAVSSPAPQPHWSRRTISVGSKIHTLVQHTYAQSPVGSPEPGGRASALKGSPSGETRELDVPMALGVATPASAHGSLYSAKAAPPPSPFRRTGNWDRVTNTHLGFDVKPAQPQQEQSP